ncbi:MAG: hypothetical protein ACYCR7_02330 [Thermoplasmataceae archaeon]
MKENDRTEDDNKDSEVIDFGTGKKPEKTRDQVAPTRKKQKPGENENVHIESMPEEVKVDNSHNSREEVNKDTRQSKPAEPGLGQKPFAPIELTPQKKKRSWWAGGRHTRASETRTVVEIKTLGDIPPIVEVRKIIGNGDRNEGTIKGFNLAKNDISRSFGIAQKTGESNRKFLIRILRELGMDIPEEANVDNTALKNAMRNSHTGSESNKTDAIKKLAFFYMDYYERAKFSDEVYSTGDDILDRLMDLYNYLDVAKLYYPTHEPVRR